MPSRSSRRRLCLAHGLAEVFADFPHSSDQSVNDDDSRKFTHFRWKTLLNVQILHSLRDPPAKIIVVATHTVVVQTHETRHSKEDARHIIEGGASQRDPMLLLRRVAEKVQRGDVKGPDVARLADVCRPD